MRYDMLSSGPSYFALPDVKFLDVVKLPLDVLSIDNDTKKVLSDCITKVFGYDASSKNHESASESDESSKTSETDEGNKTSETDEGNTEIQKKASDLGSNKNLGSIVKLGYERLKDMLSSNKNLSLVWREMLQNIQEALAEFALKIKKTDFTVFNVRISKLKLENFLKKGLNDAGIFDLGDLYILGEDKIKELAASIATKYYVEENGPRMTTWSPKLILDAMLNFGVMPELPNGRPRKVAGTYLLFPRIRRELSNYKTESEAEKTETEKEEQPIKNNVKIDENNRNAALCKRIMKKFGSMKSFAEVANINSETVDKIISGKPISYSSMWKFSKVLDCRLMDIGYGKSHDNMELKSDRYKPLYDLAVQKYGTFENFVKSNHLVNKTVEFILNGNDSTALKKIASTLGVNVCELENEVTLSDRYKPLIDEVNKKYDGMRDFAKKNGFTARTAIMIENGSNVSSSTLRAYCKALGFTFADLFSMDPTTTANYELFDQKYQKLYSAAEKKYGNFQKFVYQNKIHPKTVEAILYGKRLNQKSLESIAEILKVSVDEIKAKQPYNSPSSDNTKSNNKAENSQSNNRRKAETKPATKGDAKQNKAVSAENSMSANLTDDNSKAKTESKAAAKINPKEKEEDDMEKAGPVHYILRGEPEKLKGLHPFDPYAPKIDSSGFGLAKSASTPKVEAKSSEPAQTQKTFTEKSGSRREINPEVTGYARFFGSYKFGGSSPATSAPSESDDGSGAPANPELDKNEQGTTKKKSIFESLSASYIESLEPKPKKKHGKRAANGSAQNSMTASGSVSGATNRSRTRKSTQKSHQNKQISYLLNNDRWSTIYDAALIKFPGGIRELAQVASLQQQTVSKLLNGEDLSASSRKKIYVALYGENGLAEHVTSKSCDRKHTALVKFIEDRCGSFEKFATDNKLPFNLIEKIMVGEPISGKTISQIQSMVTNDKDQTDKNELNDADFTLNSDKYAWLVSVMQEKYGSFKAFAKIAKLRPKTVEGIKNGNLLNYHTFTRIISYLGTDKEKKDGKYEIINYTLKSQKYAPLVHAMEKKFGSFKNFAIKFNMEPATIDNILNGKSLDSVTLMRIRANLGINPRKDETKYENTDFTLKSKKYSWLVKGMEKKFGSFKNFAIENNIDHETIEKIKNGEYISNKRLLAYKKRLNMESEAVAANNNIPEKQKHNFNMKFNITSSELENKKYHALVKAIEEKYGNLDNFAMTFNLRDNTILKIINGETISDSMIHRLSALLKMNVKGLVGLEPEALKPDFYKPLIKAAEEKYGSFEEFTKISRMKPEAIEKIKNNERLSNVTIAKYEKFLGVLLNLGQNEQTAEIDYAAIQNQYTPLIQEAIKKFGNFERFAIAANMRDSTVLKIINGEPIKPYMLGRYYLCLNEYSPDKLDLNFDCEKLDNIYKPLISAANEKFGSFEEFVKIAYLKPKTIEKIKNGEKLSKLTILKYEKLLGVKLKIYPDKPKEKIDYAAIQNQYTPLIQAAIKKFGDFEKFAIAANMRDFTIKKIVDGEPINYYTIKKYKEIVDFDPFMVLRYNKMLQADSQNLDGFGFDFENLDNIYKPLISAAIKQYGSFEKFAGIVFMKAGTLEKIKKGEPIGNTTIKKFERALGIGSVLGEHKVPEQLNQGEISSNRYASLISAANEKYGSFEEFAKAVQMMPETIEKIKNDIELDRRTIKKFDKILNTSLKTNINKPHIRIDYNSLQNNYTPLIKAAVKKYGSFEEFIKVAKMRSPTIYKIINNEPICKKTMMGYEKLAGYTHNLENTPKELDAITVDNQYSGLISLAKEKYGSFEEFAKVSKLRIRTINAIKNGEPISTNTIANLEKLLETDLNIGYASKQAKDVNETIQNQYSKLIQAAIKEFGSFEKFAATANLKESDIAKIKKGKNLSKTTSDRLQFLILNNNLTLKSERYQPFIDLIEKSEYKTFKNFTLANELTKQTIDNIINGDDISIPTLRGYAHLLGAKTADLQIKNFKLYQKQSFELVSDRYKPLIESIEKSSYKTFKNLAYAMNLQPGTINKIINGEDIYHQVLTRITNALYRDRTSSENNGDGEQSFELKSEKYRWIVYLIERTKYKTLKNYAAHKLRQNMVDKIIKGEHIGDNTLLRLRKDLMQESLSETNDGTENEKYKLRSERYRPLIDSIAKSEFKTLGNFILYYRIPSNIVTKIINGEDLNHGTLNKYAKLLNEKNNVIRNKFNLDFEQKTPTLKSERYRPLMELIEKSKYKTFANFVYTEHICSATIQKIVEGKKMSPTTLRQFALKLSDSDANVPKINELYYKYVEDDKPLELKSTRYQPMIEKIESSEFKDLLNFAQKINLHSNIMDKIINGEDLASSVRKRISEGLQTPMYYLDANSQRKPKRTVNKNQAEISGGKAPATPSETAVELRGNTPAKPSETADETRKSFVNEIAEGAVRFKPAKFDKAAGMAENLGAANAENLADNLNIAENSSNSTESGSAENSNAMDTEIQSISELLDTISTELNEKETEILNNIQSLGQEFLSGLSADKFASGSESLNQIKRALMAYFKSKFSALIKESLSDAEKSEIMAQITSEFDQISGIISEKQSKGFEPQTEPDAKVSAKTVKSIFDSVSKFYNGKQASGIINPIRVKPYNPFPKLMSEFGEDDEFQNN